MLIREATAGDRAEILAVERAAFGQDDEADLVAALLDDPTASPVLSLVARHDDRVVGHILFTDAHVEGADDPPRVALLAPLAVAPDAQRQGVGGRLIERGVEQLGEDGAALVFVFGDPAYYGRHGFAAAGRWGLHAPHPLPDELADAWMVRALRPGALGPVRGRLRCADTIQQPRYWEF